MPLQHWRVLRTRHNPRYAGAFAYGRRRERLGANGKKTTTGVHVGVGISLRGGGLVAPAIHDVADQKVDELMGNLTDLVARARSFSLRSSEMSDPTMTVTNLGDKGSTPSSASSTHRR
ncbi:MAG TPA: 2-oxo acid dehydrogenase subunit E2 [Mycobacterium sp.]|nr:2-oxo acid dehydrogenase subunit E2 [Mycobacterium sp.]HUH69464.1 2-oxo acid dehydrogenase subunit E2 [Mycobacterium sp.]